MCPPLPVSLQNGDCVLIKNHTAGPFDPKYVGDFRVVKVTGNQVKLVPSTGGKSKREHVKNVKYIKPADQVIAATPDYSAFGRATKLRLNPLNILDLGWKWTDDLNTKGIGKVSNLDVIEILEDKYKRMEDIGSMFVNTTIYLRPVREKTEITNTITQSIVHAEVKSNLAKVKTEERSHEVWTQFMQGVMGESKEEVRNKYLPN